MYERWLTIGSWVAFVLLVATAAHLSLAACDLGFHPLYGLSYCKTQAGTDPLAAERERERGLLDRIHDEQVKLSRLPVCLPERPRREPDRRAEITPTPTPAPTPIPTPTVTPTPTPTPSSTPDSKLVIPRDTNNINDLNGCWQSDSGDINMVGDDANHTPIGKVRICYCLADNGGGTTRYIYQDGSRCIGPLKARLADGKLVMNHGRINCTGNKGYVVPTDITCRTKEGQDSATCDSYVHLSRPTRNTDDKYHRVSQEYCN